MLTIEPRMIIKLSNLFQTHVFLVSVLGATPNHIPLKCRCPNKASNRIRVVYLMQIECCGWPLVKWLATISLAIATYVCFVSTSF